MAAMTATAEETDAQEETEASEEVEEEVEEEAVAQEEAEAIPLAAIHSMNGKGYSFHRIITHRSPYRPKGSMRSRDSRRARSGIPPESS